MSAHEVAAQWYFDLLKSELAERGTPEAAPFLDRFLRVSPPVVGAATGESGPVELTLQQRFTQYEVRLNSQTGELISWFADVLSHDGDASMPEEEAMELARRVGQVPPEAEIETAAYEVMADRILFRARWKHVYQNLPVDCDYIEVLINGKARRPFAVSRVWREPNLTGQAMIR